jgi:Spy/CpxP family protein refolding chaperone
MKHFRTITTVILTAALFYLAFPQAVFAAAATAAAPAAAAAATKDGHSITLPQLLILGFVLGLYLYNHFKDKIKAKFKKKQ